MEAKFKSIIVTHDMTKKRKGMNVKSWLRKQKLKHEWNRWGNGYTRSGDLWAK